MKRQFPGFFGLLLLATAALRAEITPEAEEIVTRIIATQLADRQKWEAASGSGRMESETLGKQQQSVWDVEFRVQDRKLWIDYQFLKNESNRPGADNYEVVRVVADGALLVTGLYSPRIHPSGAQVEVRLDTPNDFRMASHGPRIDPRNDLLPPVMRGDSALALFRSEKATVTLASKADDRQELLIAYPAGTYCRVRSSPRLGHRIVRVEWGPLRYPDQPNLVLEYVWTKTGGDIWPEEIITRSNDRVHRLFLKTLDHRGEEIDADFTFKSLQLPARTVLIDRREKAETAVRNVDLEAIADPQNEDVSLSEMIEKFSRRN